MIGVPTISFHFPGAIMSESRAYRSKALRDSGLVAVMHYAIRGMPRTYLPGEQRVDIDWARSLYAPELEQLDALNIQSRWFWSGMIAAALISLTIWPQTIELWRNLATFRVWRDADGVDAAGLLYELISINQNWSQLTRRPEFQWYVFQVAMAVAAAWAYGDGQRDRYTQTPPVPDILELIERIRKVKAASCSADGFRPPACLRPDWVLIAEPAIIHNNAMPSAIELAMAMVDQGGQAVSRSAIEQTAAWAQEQSPLPEYEHPAALAAALITISLSPGTQPIWRRVWHRQGIRLPNPAGRPYADASQIIQDAIHVANRSSSPQHDALYLYHRCVRCVRTWQENPDHLWSQLPTIQRRTLDRCNPWMGSRINFVPELRFGASRPRPRLQSVAGGD